MSFEEAIRWVILSLKRGNVPNAISILEGLIPQVDGIGDDALRFRWLEAHQKEIVFDGSQLHVGGVAYTYGQLRTNVDEARNASRADAKGDVCPGPVERQDVLPDRGPEPPTLSGDIGVGLY
jgi:hypothetical protein